MGLKQGYCYSCRSKQPFEVTPPNHVLHLLITCFLCCTWLPVWMLITMKGGTSACRTCGTRERSSVVMLIGTLAAMAVIGFVVLTIIVGLSNGGR